MPGDLRAAVTPLIGRGIGDARLSAHPRGDSALRRAGLQGITVGDRVTIRSDLLQDGPAGLALLGHEMTHAAQQRGRLPVMQAQEGEGEKDLPPVPTTPEEAEALSDEELERLISTWNELVRAGAVPADAAAAANMHLVLDEWERRNGLRPGSALFTDTDALTNRDLPFPTTDLGPASLAPDLPEGVVVEVDPASLPAAVQLRAGLDRSWIEDADIRGWPVSQAGRLTGALTDYHLLTRGFASAGPDAIGLVGYPNVLNLRALRNLDVPQSPILFGHLMAYSRGGGRISNMASFAPESLLAAGVDSWTGRHRGVPAHIIHHLDPQAFPLSISGTHGFPNTSALSVEWPVTPEASRRFSEFLSRATPDDVARYAAWLEKSDGGKNCVSWALDQVERELGGPVGQAGQPPLRHQSGLNTARQGRFQALAEELLVHQESGGARGTPLADTPNAPGSPVAGRMSRSMRVLKWGGRLLMVAGYGISAYRISNASDEALPFVVMEEAAGTVGGPLGGVVAELYVAPMRELAEGRGDATMLILPHPYIAPVVRILEPEKHDPEGGRLIRRAVLDNDPDAIDEVLRRLFGGF